MHLPGDCSPCLTTEQGKSTSASTVTKATVAWVSSSAAPQPRELREAPRASSGPPQRTARPANWAMECEGCWRGGGQLCKGTKDFPEMVEHAALTMMGRLAVSTESILGPKKLRL
ncbi:uncharacterized protein AAES06_009410 [Glossophaga mutica]